MVKGLIYSSIFSFTELYQIFKKYQNRCFNPLSLSIMMTNDLVSTSLFTMGLTSGLFQIAEVRD